jgi:hypothetical protein
MPAGWVSAAAAAVGVANQMGAFGGGGGGGSTSSGTYDPYGQYRGQAATQLNDLMNNPSLAMSQPGYQQQLQQGLVQSQRGAAATGMLQSGAEANALQSQGQNTFASYYNSQLANLMQLSGASQSPAAAGLAQQQAATASQNRAYQNLGQLTSTIGAVGNLFNNPNQTSSQNIAGYASSGPSYQNSFGSDTQFGSYDSGAYQGPV